jgi:uncharacterized Tic20 family protein
MSYLICEKCEGHYELQEGESEEDFVNCECGGKLNYVKNLDGSKGDKSSKLTLKYLILVIFSIIFATFIPIIGVLIGAFIIWWVFFHKNVDILSQGNRNIKSDNKGIIKKVIYVILLLISALVYLSQAANLYRSSIWTNMVLFVGLVALFLVVKYLLDRI